MTIDKAISEIIGTNYGEVQCHQETMVLAVAALREKAERMSGCDWCIGFCPDVTGDPHADYNFCPMCGKRLEVEHE